MPKILSITIYPNPILRKKSAEITKVKINSAELRDLSLSMAKTMLKKEGLGLAAPQIGENIRLAVINTKDGVITLINPKITRKSLGKELGEEGCLSLPNIFGQVKRHKEITCEFFDFNIQRVKLKAKGLLARVIQHEVDHLDGILFIDKAKNVKHVTRNT